MPTIGNDKDDQGYNVPVYVLRCVGDPDHETYVSKNRGATKNLTAPGGQKTEVDVLTQQPTEAGLVLVDSEESALVAVKKANSLGMWPKEATPQQAILLAHAAYHYQMDIYMGEIMPYQGKPFITIKGRRRYDKQAGNRMGITFRMPRQDELDYWMESGAMTKGDVIQIAIGIELDGLVTEEMGRVLQSEQPTTQAGRDNLPISVRKIEMAQKRAESRLREVVFGAIGKPPGLTLEMEVLGEGDDSNVIEGSGRVIPDNEEPVTFPDFGECPEHGVAWKVEADKYTGAARATHFVAKGDDGKSIWCQLGPIYKEIFAQLWMAKYGEPDKNEVNDWLKDKFGKTWSKLGHLECVQAVDAIRVNENGEIDEAPYMSMPDDEMASAEEEG
jgi:hypothetical protein